jgi:hypothetical protein
MDLRDGAVDPPTRAHFTPVKDEFLLDGSESSHFSLISVHTEITLLQRGCK